MSGTDVDTLATYGGGLQDYSPPIDPTTDRGATGANQAYAAIAGLTHCGPHTMARITWNGTSAPSLVSHDEAWNNGSNVAPVPARTGVGLGTLTYPTNLVDEIPSGVPGHAAGGHNTNIRFAWGNSENLATLYIISASVTAPNVISFSINQIAGPVDPNPTTFAIFGI